MTKYYSSHPATSFVNAGGIFTFFVKRAERKFSNYFKVGIFVLVSSLMAVAANAQTAGDYRTNQAAVTWTTPAQWQKYDGVSWNTATEYPGQTSGNAGDVQILTG